MQYRLPLSDCSDKMVIDSGFIRIQDLTPGRYRLQCVMTDTSLQVLLYIVGGGLETNKDQFWTNLTLGHSWIAETPGEMVRNPLTIKDVVADDQNISVNLQNFSNKTYAIVSGSSTLSHRTPQENYFPKRTQKRHFLRRIGECQNNSSFVSGRKLSEEYQYILERSRLHKWTSTTLQNPALLIKRQEKSETTVTSKRVDDDEEDDDAGLFGSPSFKSIERALMRGEQLMALNSYVHWDAIPEYGRYTKPSINLS